MDTTAEGDGGLAQEDHQACYIFDPSKQNQQNDRAPKKRKTTKHATQSHDDSEMALSAYVPLLNGSESLDCVHARQELFETCWSEIDSKVQRILRESNQATLDRVNEFMMERPQTDNRIPAAFITTGPNIASQDLLFEQLSESLQESSKSRFVRLKSSGAGNLKTVLKKIIRDVTSRQSQDEDDAEIAVGQDGRKYLDYDLAGLYTFTKQLDYQHIFVAFEDSEGFDNGLVSDLVLLFKSWRDKIPFSLLFGVATSVDLLQARLSRSVIPCIYGAQFDVVQSSTILERVFRAAVTSSSIPVRVGPGLLRSLLTRQRDEMVGIKDFINSIKYAYMCHFYANPLSVFAASAAVEAQTEHLQALRTVQSFREHVEASINQRDLQHAKALLEDDESATFVLRDVPSSMRRWCSKLLQCLQILEALGVVEDYPELYITLLENGVAIELESSSIAKVWKMGSVDLIIAMERIAKAIEDGDSTICITPLASHTKETNTFYKSIAQLLQRTRSLQEKAQQQGLTLRSTYNSQKQVLRTTVVAQKVQLSHDSASLTDEDKEFTAIVDSLVELLVGFVRCDAAAGNLWHEVWLYDAKLPLRDVFIPRPRAVFERSLTRPHDYLACACCGSAEGADAATLPHTALLYRLYQETGSLVNVADLFSAFSATLGAGGEDDNGNGGYGEREALVLFYRALADLRALGFVKQSRKKDDHIAKLKWL